VLNIALYFLLKVKFVSQKFAFLNKPLFLQEENQIFICLRWLKYPKNVFKNYKKKFTAKINTGNLDSDHKDFENARSVS